jgi:DNA invertase Pin-like site-specific DNA recombinase
LRELGVQHVDAFVATRSKLDPKTVHNLLTLLISVLNAAVDLGWLAKVPRIKKPKVRMFSADYRYLRTDPERDAFLRAAREEGEDVFALYATAVFTGMRAGELGGLRWDAVDFERRLLTVQRSFRQGVSVVAMFEDHGVSGAAELGDRPSLLAALAAVRTHGAGVLVAAKRDRIARDTVVAAMVERTAVAAGAVVRTADGASDASGPEGLMMRGMTDLFAAYERELIRARTRAALGVKRARGERIGGVPYGFELALDGVHLVAVEAEQRTIARARELRAHVPPRRGR